MLVLLVLFGTFFVGLQFFKPEENWKYSIFPLYLFLGTLFIIFSSSIEVTILWMVCLINRIWNNWEDIKESFCQNFINLIYTLQLSNPQQSRSFYYSQSYFTKLQRSFSYKKLVSNRKNLIFISILIILSPTQIKMDCSSRFSFNDHNCILTPSSQLKCWG